MQTKTGKQQSASTGNNGNKRNDEATTTTTTKKSLLKNPIKQLIGTAKSKLRVSSTKSSRSLSSSTSATSSSIKAPAGGDSRHQKRKSRKVDVAATTVAAGRSSSEPALPAATSTNRASSNLSISPCRTGRSSPLSRSASSRSSRRLFKGRNKKRSTVKPSSASSLLAMGRHPVSGSARSRRSLQEHREPVFSLDIRTQNTRLVTSRQRQEIYALNRVMTRLENERFKQFCLEKGHRGDGDDLQEGSYDIFM